MRSRDFEREWLAAVVGQVGISASEFTDAVLRRLQKGEREYAENDFTSRPLLELLAEAREETEDAPAWLVLLTQRLHREDIPETHARHIARILIEAASKSVEAWQLLQLAEEVYEEAEAEVVRPNAPPVALCP